MKEYPSTIFIQDHQRNSKEANAAILVAMTYNLEYQFTSNLIKKNDSLVMGSVEYIRSWFQRYDIQEPEPLDYPESLSPYFNRNIRKTTYKNSNTKNCFVKPVTTKQFEYDKIPDNLHPDTLVWESEYANWIAEFRVYILNKEIIGISQYGEKGDDIDLWKNSDNLTEIKAMVNSFKDSPSAYAIDIGLTNNNTLDIIEVNDAWATGIYPWGISSDNYIKWLWRRWNEIISSSLDSEL